MNKEVYRPEVWASYNRKLRQRIVAPQFVGVLEERVGLRRVIGRKERGKEKVVLYWLVDEMDGVIADVRYQMRGPTQLVGVVEAACSFLVRKNYDQASRIRADLIDREMREKEGVEAFSVACYGYVNMVMEAIVDAARQCMDIPIDEAALISPLPPEMVMGDGVEGWEGLGEREKLGIIEQVIQEEIRPYIELDAGGIQVVRLGEDGELVIKYEGSCTSCHSATGSTLTAIQQILRAKVWQGIRVVPELVGLSD